CGGKTTGGVEREARIPFFFDANSRAMMQVIRTRIAGCLPDPGGWSREVVLRSYCRFRKRKGWFREDDGCDAYRSSSRADGETCCRNRSGYAAKELFAPAGKPIRVGSDIRQAAGNAQTVRCAGLVGSIAGRRRCRSVRR